MCRREVHIFSYKRVITCLKAHNHAGSISFCKKSSQTSKALQQHLNYCAAEIQPGKIPRTQTAHMLILLIAMIRDSADASKDADDKARGKKKDVASFFQSTKALRKKAGNLSVQQEEADIKSTGARNDYILGFDAME